MFFALEGRSQHAPDPESLITSLICRPLRLHEFVSHFPGTLGSYWARRVLAAPCSPLLLSMCYQPNRVVLATEYQDDYGPGEVSCLENRRLISWIWSPAVLPIQGQVAFYAPHGWRWRRTHSLYQWRHFIRLPFLAPKVTTRVSFLLQTTIKWGGGGAGDMKQLCLGFGQQGAKIVIPKREKTRELILPISLVL